MLAVNTIQQMDCLIGLAGLPAACMDACVTDPPYGIGFMGKGWDGQIPPIEIWREVLRVLKPGAHLLCACGTRTQHRMAVNIEDAGFEIRDVLCWHYGQGFPKSLDIGKAIRKNGGCQNWEGWGTGLKPATEFWTLARKPISEKTIAENVLLYGTGGLHIETGRTIDGRFPANVLLDEFMAEELDRQSGELESGKPSGKRKAGNKVYRPYPLGQEVTGYGDSGGASRFFYVAKADAAERGKGNHHPTVKPIALMQYLLRLICPIEPGRIVLDPFSGSGSTCIAARLLGIDFVAFDLLAEYVAIAKGRLREQLGLFDAGNK
jgi:site-specific DNA-methyltransferase (adenine-specific)